MTEKPIYLLLIEDNPGDARLIQEILHEVKGVQFRLHCVDRLAAGIEYLEQKEIDVVLLDLTLPDSRGFETFTKIREKVPLRPIIILTGQDDESLAVKAVREGAQDYLVKGQVEGGILVRSIRYAIERKRVEDASRSIVEQSLQGLVIAQGIPPRIVFTNTAMADILGYSVEDLASLSSDQLQSHLYPEDRAVFFQRFQDRLEGKPVPSRYEFRLIRRNGDICWVEMFASRIEYEGKPAIQAAFVDITERKRAEEAQRTSELQYRSTIDSMGDAIHVLDRNLRFLLCNRALKHWNKELGIETDIIGRSVFEIYPFLSEKVGDEYREVFHTGKMLITEETTRVTRREFITETRKIPVFENGQVSQVVTVIRDVSDRKEAEKALRESEEKYRSLINNSQDAIYLLHDGKFEIINKKFEELFGYTQEETNAPDFNFMKLVAPKSRSLIQERVEKVERGQIVSSRYEFTALSKEGEEIEVEPAVSYIQYKGGIATQGILRDITERKKAEEAIRKRAARLALIASVGQKTTAILELDELLHQAVRLIGDAFHYYNVILLLLEDETLVLRATTLPPLQPFENQVRLQAGSEGITGWVAKHGEPLIVPDVSKESRYRASLKDMETQSEMAVPIVSKGTIIGVLDAQSAEINAFSEDDVFTLQTLADQIAVAIENAQLYEQAEQEIADRKRMEESLRIERDKLRIILDNMHAQVVMEDQTYNIIYQNRKSVEAVGERIGSKCYKVFRLGQKPCKNCFCAVNYFLREQQSDPYMYTSTTADGLTLETFAMPIMNEKGDRVVLEIAMDITEQEKLRSQLLQSEKMSALGLLISGVAHELNNPLTGVLGYAQLLLMSPDLPGKSKQSLQTICQEAERARKIVQNLLTFARQSKPTKRILQINKVVDQTLELRAYEMRVNNIEVIREFDPKCPPIFGDEHQLQQVFMNLFINAEQAMLEAHGKGRLKVTTQWLKESNMSQISFQDDGPGIAEEHLSKVFDPFFTTKPVGKGTGLGLSISYGIIKEHGGVITAANEKDRGAKFTVTLPVQMPGNAENQSLPIRIEYTTKLENKKILIIDDEALVVDLVKEALEGEGHTVEMAYDGESALRKIKEDNYDAIVSDLKMPGKDGVTIYHFCQECKPRLAEKFLFLTGDVGNSDTIRFIEDCNMPYLSKPFDVKDLVAEVNLLFRGDA
ncbi:MAG: PAS domain S-box protein [Gemmatimonadota bacterium]|nr:MAG: PAS domain S-box protein [Gemmatimonadota bacterium]